MLGQFTNKVANFFFSLRQKVGFLKCTLAGILINLFVVYFDQLLGAVRTLKMVETHFIVTFGYCGGQKGWRLAKFFFRLSAACSQRRNEQSKNVEIDTPATYALETHAKTVNFQGAWPVLRVKPVCMLFKSLFHTSYFVHAAFYNILNNNFVAVKFVWQISMPPCKWCESG